MHTKASVEAVSLGLDSRGGGERGGGGCALCAIARAPDDARRVQDYAAAALHTKTKRTAFPKAAAATVAARGVEGIAVAAKSTTEQQLSEVIVAT